MKKASTTTNSVKRLEINEKTRRAYGKRDRALDRDPEALQLSGCRGTTVRLWRGTRRRWIPDRERWKTEFHAVFGPARKRAEMFRAEVYANVCLHTTGRPCRCRTAPGGGWAIATQVCEVGSEAAARQAHEQLLEIAAGSNMAGRTSICQILEIGRSGALRRSAKGSPTQASILD